MGNYRHVRSNYQKNVILFGASKETDGGFWIWVTKFIKLVGRGMRSSRETNYAINNLKMIFEVTSINFLINWYDLLQLEDCIWS